MQYLKSRKQMREAKRKHNQKERVQFQQQSKVLQSLEEEALANARVFDRYDSMLTAKGRDTLHGVPQVNVCRSLEARELKQPGRTVYRPKLQVQSNTPIILYYVAYAGLLHALFFCADHVPEIAAVANWQGSTVVAMLSIVVMIAGTRLHNGAMIAAALLFAWQAVGASSLTLVGPLYYLSLFFPPFIQRVIMAAMATVITVFMVTRLILKSNTIAVRSVKKGVNYVKGTKHRRVQAAVNEKILKQFNSTYVEIELVDNPGTIVRALLDSGAALSVFSLRSVKRVWHKMKRTLRQTVAGDSMTAAGGGGMGPNVGLADLKFRFVGRPEVMDWPVEIVDNDGVPSILGVDLLKHLGATLQYSDAGDACSWINDSGERVVIPMHCTAPEISGEFSLTVAEGTLLQPSGEAGDKAVTYAYVDIAPENVRCNQQFYCTPDIVTVEVGNSITGKDSHDLQPTICMRNSILTPTLKLINGKHRVMVPVPLRNHTDSDMVLAPGSRIGSVTILSRHQTEICSVSKEEYCEQTEVKVQLDDYVKASRTAEAREGVKKFKPKTELPKTDWRRTLKYDVPDMIERVWLHENKSDYNDFIKRYEKDLKFGKVLDSEQIERMKLLLSFLFFGR